jgi:hypothetical protein
VNDLDLEQRLATPHAELLGRPDLATIRRQGTRRRRGRVAAVVAGAGLAVAAVTGIGIGVGGLGSDDAQRQTTVYAPPKAPPELSPLAKRVLSDIPGAKQVSPGQVVIPGPGTGTQLDEELAPDVLAQPLVPLGAHTYSGVTAYTPDQLPGWLYDRVQRIEKQLGSKQKGFPVGSTEMGILVDSGRAQLACLADRSSHGEDMPGEGCYPALVSTVGASSYLGWAMGSDDFLEPGREMELFTSEDYSSGSPSTVWIGGLDGTDVTRVVYEMADGSTTGAEVLAGTLVPGDTIFWANVPGDLTHVTAYDAAGDVVDDHAITSCSGGVDCEVR